MDRRTFVTALVPGAALAGGLGLPALDRAAGSPTASWPATRASQELIEAVIRGDVARVRTLLARDASLVYARDEEGRSVYVLAHLHGHSAVASVLEGQGFVKDAVESVLARDWDRLEELSSTSYGIVNADHPIGGTAMYAGALIGLGLEMWRVQQFGGDPNGNPRGLAGHTPSRAAVDHADPVTALATAATLLGNGGDANTPERAASSVLHGAAATGDVDLVRLVLRKGGDPDAVDDAGRRPVDVARSADHPAVVELLRDHAQVRRDHRSSRFAYTADGRPYQRPALADYDRRTVDRTVGAAHFDVDATRSATDRVPDLTHAVSASDEGAVEACAHTGRRPVVELLLERGAPYSLPTALTMGDLTWARRLLDEDPRRVDERGAHDFAVMWYPAIGQSVEAAELLLERGADLEQEHLGTTGLHFAVRGGLEDLAAFLIERGADLDALGRKFAVEGETPLDIAVDRGHERIAGMLRAAGARHS